MESNRVWRYLSDTIKERGALFILLVDPDSSTDDVAKVVERGCKHGIDLILIGGSFLLKPDFSSFVEFVKEKSSVPVVIFPGGSSQLSPHADGILFMSLISGRNPVWLIDEQVKSAPLVKSYGLEVIPTGYMLIGSNSSTAVAFVSHTQPIPSDKPELICAHGLAAKYLGMKLLYLDAGSGASEPVSSSVISALKAYVELPIFVGGGITSPNVAKGLVNAGASGIVIGNLFEKAENLALFKDFKRAIHQRYISQG